MLKENGIGYYYKFQNKILHFLLAGFDSKLFACDCLLGQYESYNVRFKGHLTTVSWLHSMKQASIPESESHVILFEGHHFISV